MAPSELRSAIVPVVSAEDAVREIPSGASVMVGGFGLTGAPLTLIDALVLRADLADLTIISNNLGEPERGLDRALTAGRIRHAVGSYFTSNPNVIKAMQEGRLTVDVLPQGTFSEAIRAGGAGLGGFFTPTGAGTRLAEHKEARIIDEREYIFERALRADVALVRARRADRLGNLVFHATARNFNPLMATAADLVIAEVDELVDAGDLEAEEIITPGIFVDRLVRARTRHTGAGAGGAPRSGASGDDHVRDRIAQRAAVEVHPGDVVNLGIGIPTLVPRHLRSSLGAQIHSENGILGVAARPEPGDEDWDLVDAAKQPIAAHPGAAFFDSAASFAMIRGGAIDVSIMGALQVSADGDLANWAIPGRPVLGVGGAMDLAVGARRVVVTMLHTTPNGAAKLVTRCDLPVTARGVVDLVVTEFGVLRPTGETFALVDLAPGVSLETLRACTAAPITISEGGGDEQATRHPSTYGGKRR